MTVFYTIVAALVVLTVLAVLYWRLLNRALARPTDADEIFEVTTDDLWKLRLYRYRSASAPNEPVVLVHSALANHRNFTTPGQMNLVKTLTARGYDCWVLELRGTRSSEPPHGRQPWEVVFDDYILHDLPAAVEAVTSVTGFDRVHYAGHSLGGMVLYAYCLIHQDPGIASAATLGAPPGFAQANIRPSYTLLGVYKTLPRFTAKLLRALTPLLALYRPGLRFLPLNWHTMHPGIGITDFFNLLDSQPPQVISQLAYWAESNTWHADHSQVDVLEGLRRLKLPLLAIFGQRDPFIAVETARAFFDGLPGIDKDLRILPEYSHCDLAFGRNGEQDVYEPVAEWFAAHPMAGTPAAKDSVKEKPPRKRKAPAKKKAAAAPKKTPARRKRTPGGESSAETA